MPSGWREPCPRVNFARRSPGPGGSLPSRARARPAGEGQAGEGPGEGTLPPPRPQGAPAACLPEQNALPPPSSPAPARTAPWPRRGLRRSDDDIRPRGPARECPGRGRARRGRGRRAGAGSQLPDPPRSARRAGRGTVWRREGARPRPLPAPPPLAPVRRLRGRGPVACAVPVRSLGAPGRPY